jgi:hypothetical protein
MKRRKAIDRAPACAENRPGALLTVFDVAAILRLKPAAVRLLAATGAIGYFRVHRGLRFASSDVEAFLERARRPARDEQSRRSAV